MRQEDFFKYILDLVNTNTQGLKFKGNFAYVRHGDAMYMYEQDSLNPYNVKKERYIAVAETTDENTPYREENKRNGWIKEYSFQFGARKKDTVIAALNELKDNIDIAGIVTIDSDKYSLKSTYPRYISKSKQQNGDIELTYAIAIFSDSVLTGSFGDEATITMNKVGQLAQSIIYDTIAISTGIGMNPSSKVTDELNATHEPISSKTTMVLDMYYDGTDLCKDIYKVASGKLSRKTKFDIQTVFDGITQSYTLWIEGGSYTFKKGVIFRMQISMVEV